MAWWWLESSLIPSFFQSKQELSRAIWCDLCQYLHREGNSVQRKHFDLKDHLDISSQCRSGKLKSWLLIRNKQTRKGLTKFSLIFPFFLLFFHCFINSHIRWKNSIQSVLCSNFSWDNYQVYISILSSILLKKLQLGTTPSVVIIPLRTVTEHFKVHLVNFVELLHGVQTELRKILPC